MDMHTTAWLHAPWTGADAPLPVRDQVVLAGLSAPLRLVLAGSPDAPAFCVLAGGCAAEMEASASALYQCEAMAWLQRRGRVATDAGGWIVFDSPLAMARAQVLQMDAGASSNCVTRIAVDGQVAMHKVYRRLSAHNHELAATRALDGACGALRCLGGYRYERADGAVFALGLLTGYVEGEGLYAPLSRDIRAFWAEGDTGAGARPAPALLEELAGWRAHLAGLHAALAGCCPPMPAPPAFDLAALRETMRARVAILAPRVRDDAALDPARARRLAGLLARLDRADYGCASLPAPAAAPCHGDLHLSHLLRERSGARRVIDLSPPALDPHTAEFRSSSPLCDWVALERALDYVFLDEAALALSGPDPAGQRHCMGRLHALAEPHAARRLAAGLAWHAAVRAALCGPHLADPARAPFYLARLLQELDYNYRQRRPYFRCIDWFFLERHFSYLCGE